MKINSFQNKDNSTIIATIACVILIAVGISIGGNLINFVDLPSFLIVFGGTFLVTVACYNFQDVWQAFKTSYEKLFIKTPDYGDIAYETLKASELAYKKSILWLANEDRIMGGYHKFFAEGVRLLSDNITVEYLENYLNQNVLFMVEQNKQAISIFRKAAEIAPAMGLIGTLIGLVQMLASFNEINKIGPSMALALITTFYGSILSYVFFYPTAAKLERNTHIELIIRKIYIEALISIGKKENPRILEMKLNNILPTDQKIHYFKS
ncbi:motility protein A [Rickettsiales endosymbiont of Stachyamoeba lipophora]|uniref:motility protein A n=1 Tax=Rickettsiales endosymbiont of Stachyamoeba lipophora TaxID=2486578 RepID=UPI000F6465C0|nr:MotA/TolQ/ExbB proton channel family protein [Rickettsiales endosymbiont of Stachyamoeba lipophora]AZL15281.1 flagellar motor protein MotA [Rickettsiales endosymbiont of Stachyamoeba lipophora]